MAYEKPVTYIRVLLIGLWEYGEDKEGEHQTLPDPKLDQDLLKKALKWLGETGGFGGHTSVKVDVVSWPQRVTVESSSDTPVQPGDNAQPLDSPQPDEQTPDALKNWLEMQASRPWGEHEHALIVYVSGHGERASTDDGKTTCKLVLPSRDVQGDYLRISLEDLANWVVGPCVIAIPPVFRHVLLLFNVCHSGGAYGDYDPPDTIIPTDHAVKAHGFTLEVMTAAAEQQEGGAFRGVSLFAFEIAAWLGGHHDKKLGGMVSPALQMQAIRARLDKRSTDLLSQDDKPVRQTVCYRMVLPWLYGEDESESLIALRKLRGKRERRSLRIPLPWGVSLGTAGGKEEPLLPSLTKEDFRTWERSLPKHKLAERLGCLARIFDCVKPFKNPIHRVTVPELPLRLFSRSLDLVDMAVEVAGTSWDLQRRTRDLIRKIEQAAGPLCWDESHSGFLMRARKLREKVSKHLEKIVLAMRGASGGLRRDVKIASPTDGARSFWISLFPVTRRQHSQVMKGGQSTQDRLGVPQTNVSFDDAQEFCALVDGRLPTMAEWSAMLQQGQQASNVVAGLGPAVPEEMTEEGLEDDLLWTEDAFKALADAPRGVVGNTMDWVLPDSDWAAEHGNARMPCCRVC